MHERKSRRGWVSANALWTAWIAWSMTGGGNVGKKKIAQRYRIMHSLFSSLSNYTLNISRCGSICRVGALPVVVVVVIVVVIIAQWRRRRQSAYRLYFVAYTHTHTHITHVYHSTIASYYIFRFTGIKCARVTSTMWVSVLCAVCSSLCTGYRLPHTLQA